MNQMQQRSLGQSFRASLNWSNSPRSCLGEAEKEGLIQKKRKASTNYPTLSVEKDVHNVNFDACAKCDTTTFGSGERGMG